MLDFLHAGGLQLVRILTLLLMVLASLDAMPLGDSSPILSHGNQVRQLRLYTDNDWRHFYLQITEMGDVGGSTDLNDYTVLEIKPVQIGVVVIKGVKSCMFLCMDSSGRLYGSRTEEEKNCRFKEEFRHGYNVYFSNHHQTYVTLSVGRRNHLFQFLPMVKEIPKIHHDQVAEPSLKLWNWDIHDMFHVDSAYEGSLSGVR